MFDKKQTSVFTRLLSMQLLASLISLIIIGSLFGYLLQKYFFGVMEWDLIDQGNQLTRLLASDLQDGRQELARERLYTVAESDNIDLWMFNTEGEIQIGSRLAYQDQNLSLKPHELQQVLEGNQFTKKSMGPQVQKLLVVLPIYSEGQTIGALALRAPLGDLGSTVNYMMRLIFLAALAAGVVVVLLSLYMSKGFARPLEQLKRATLEIARGKFPRLSTEPHSSEVDHLVEAFNYASRQIEKVSLEQQNLEKLRREFVSSLSHELRAPLTSLKGFLELMEMPLPPSEQEKYRKIMLEDTLYLERLVKDVLELSFVESGQFSLEQEEVLLHSIINNTVASLELQFGEKDLAVELDVPDNLRFWADPQRIRQVFLNLLLNALQYTYPNTTISVEAWETANEIGVAVSDQGPGIPKEYQADIWQKFYKLDKARTRTIQGSGLGLAIVKEIVESHGGRVDVKSEEGKGATFLVYFPKNKEEVA